MKSLAGTVVLGAVLLPALYACTGSEKPAGPAVADLIGLWLLDSMKIQGALFIVDPAAGSSTRDIDTVLIGDSTTRLELRSDRSYSLVPPPDFTGFAIFGPDSGTWSLSGNELVLDNSLEALPVRIRLDSGILRLDYPLDKVIHWTWSGAEITTNLDVTLIASRP